MIFDPRVENRAHDICYLVGENENITLSDKSRHDVFSICRTLADYWKKEVDEVNSNRYALKWNELGMWVDRYPKASMQDVLMVIALLNSGEYIRDYKPIYLQIEEEEFRND